LKESFTAKLIENASQFETHFNNSKMEVLRMKRTVSLFLTVLLALALACPALAMEAPENAVSTRSAALYPTEVVETSDGENRRLEKVYLLTAADDPGNIPTADFDREGWHYTLLDVTRQDYSESDTQEYTETVTLDSNTKDMDQIMPQLAATKEVTTEDGYTGTLTLDTSSIQVEAAGYGSSSRTVSATRSYPNLSDADSALIPKTIQDSGRTLTLADVQWQEAGGYYNASATYTGTATSSYATGYTVSAEYAGEVVKTISGEVIYTAVFSGTPLDGTVKDNSTETQPPEEQKDAGGIGWKWLLILPLGAGAAGLAYLGNFLLKKYKAKKEWKEYTK